MKTLKISLILALLFPVAGYSLEKYQVVEDAVNIRQDSTIQSAVIGNLSQGQICEVVEKKFDWYKIVLPQDFTCYARGEFFKRTEANKGVVEASVLNLRDKPALESKIIGKAKNGEVFTIVGETDGWFQVQGYPRIYGWVNEKFLQEIKTADGEKDVDDLLVKLSHAVMAEKKEIHEALINKGCSIIPKLEAYIPSADIHSRYSIIYILGQLGRVNSELALDFLMKIDTVSDAGIAGIYLDVVQDIVKPQGEMIPYFYLAVEGRLTSSHIKEARNYLHQEYNRNISHRL